MKVVLCILFVFFCNHLFAQAPDSLTAKQAIIDSSATVNTYPIVPPRYPLSSTELGKQQSRIGVNKPASILLNWKSSDPRFLKDPKKDFEAETIFTSVVKSLLEAGSGNRVQ